MNKITMAIVLIGAFLYACWLVGRRRQPVHHGQKGVRRTFLLVTLFFMSWLGAPAVAAESELPATVAEVVDGGDIRSLGVSDAMRSAWRAMGIMARWDYVQVLGSEQEQEQLRLAEERYDQANKRYVEIGHPHWVAYNNTPNPEQRQAAKDKYYAIGEPLEKERRKAGETFRELRKKAEARIARESRDAFTAALEQEKTTGRLSEGAAVLLEMAYFHLDAHFDRKKATCYMFLPAIYKPRQDLHSQIILLAKAAGNGALPPDVVDAAKLAIANDLLTLYEMSEGKSLRTSRLGNDWVETADPAPLAQFDRQQLDEYSDEAAARIAELSALLPENWAKSR